MPTSRIDWTLFAPKQGILSLKRCFLPRKAKKYIERGGLFLVEVGYTKNA